MQHFVVLFSKTDTKKSSQSFQKKTPTLRFFESDLYTRGLDSLGYSDTPATQWLSLSETAILLRLNKRKTHLNLILRQLSPQNKRETHQASLRLQPNDITQAIKYTNATPTNLITKGITKQTHKFPFALQRYAKHIKYATFCRVIFEN